MAKIGYGVEQKELQPESREEIINHIFEFMMKDETRDVFLQTAVQFLLQNGKELEDGKISFSLEDQDMQRFCVLYATQNVMDKALDENIDEAYALLAMYTAHPKFADIQKKTLTQDDLTALEKYYEATPELKLAKQVCDINLEVSSTMHGQSEKVLTTFQANRIQEKFEELTPYLTFEQCAAGFYNISMIHRALLAEKDYYDPAENNAEKECLKKVLEYTTDYKRISYCANRLGPQYSNPGLIRAAYRRALTSAASENDCCKINQALAECYINDYHPRIGYKMNNQPDSELQKLERAEMYYVDALAFAQEPEKLNILKSIAKLQKRQNKLDQWTVTMTTMAMDLMSGEERCHTLMEVANKQNDLKAEFLDRVIYEADRSKEIDKSRKAILINKASTLLRPIYNQQQDEKGLDYLNKMSAKYNKVQQSISNPLTLYKKRKSR